MFAHIGGVTEWMTRSPAVDRISKIGGSLGGVKRLDDREYDADHVDSTGTPDLQIARGDVDRDRVISDSPFGNIRWKRDVVPCPVSARIDRRAGCVDLDPVYRDSDVRAIA